MDYKSTLLKQAKINQLGEKKLKFWNPASRLFNQEVIINLVGDSTSAPTRN